MKLSRMFQTALGSTRRPNQGLRARGFSLVECMVVATIAVVMMAIAVPTVNQGLRTYRLSFACTDVANLIQRTRYEAIKKNTTVSLRTTTQAGNSVVYIDRNDNKTWDATEPVVVLPQDTPLLTAGVAPGPSSMGGGYANAQVPTAITPITFDSRGTVSFGGGAATVYVFYLGRTSNAATDGYKAVTVTPIGRTKIWSTRGTNSWYTY